MIHLPRSAAILALTATVGGCAHLLAQQHRVLTSSAIFAAGGAVAGAVLH